jgi:hypothetical protein
MKTLIREIPLSNGLTVRFFDATRRYFGDYHQVRIEISCEIPLTPDLFESAEAYEKGMKQLGGKVQYLKKIEQQGVATDAIAGVVENVIRQFMAHSLSYLEAESFPKKLVKSELDGLSKKRRVLIPMHANG